MARQRAVRGSLATKMALSLFFCFGWPELARADLTDELEETQNKQTSRQEDKRPSQEPPKAKVLESSGPRKNGKQGQEPEKRQSAGAQTRSVQKTENKPGDSAKKDEKNLPVSWNCDGLSGIKQEGNLELLSNVKVQQGGLTLTSSKARVIFNPKNDEVDKVIAEGDVRIHKVDPNGGAEVHAKGEIGEFYNSTQVVVLKGNAELTRGKDVIKGHQINYDLKTGWIHAEKVKGVVQPGEQP